MAVRPSSPVCRPLSTKLRIYGTIFNSKFFGGR